MALGARRQRRGRRPGGWALACLAASLAFLQGCGPPRPTEVRIGLPSAPISFDPHATNELVALAVNSNIYEALVSTDADLNLRPALAANWYTPDPLTWVFDLKPGVRFQDGSPLTSEDVAFSIRRAESDPQSEWGAELLRIQDVETPSATRITVRTRAPDPTVIRALAETLIVPRSAGPIAQGTLSERPVGSGPYRLESWDPHARLARLAAWPGYRGPRPAVERLTFLSIPDDRERVDALLSGRLDLVSEVPADLTALVRSTPRARLGEVTGLTEIYLGFDVSRPRALYASPARNPFLDRRVREAFQAAIDREKLVRDALQGAGEVADQPVSPRVFGYAPDRRLAGYDLDRARRLMKEAGYEEGFTVVLDAPSASFVGDVRVGPFLVNALRTIGVEVTLRAQPKKDLFRRLADRDTSLFVDGWDCTSGDMQEVLDFLLHTRDVARGYGRENTGGYANPALDALTERAGSTLDRAARLDLLRAASEIVGEDLPWIPLYITHDHYGISRSLRWAPRPDRLILGAEMRLGVDEGGAP